MEHPGRRLHPHARPRPRLGEEHGHLAVPHDATHGGHPVGRWLGECRRKTKQGRLAAGHEEALDAVDPWWNPPPGFTLMWRRFYAYAKAHTDAHGTDHVPNADKTSDGTPLGQWINRQRNHFHELHPAQVQLLLELHLAPHADSVHQGDRDTKRFREFRIHLEAAAQYLAREGDLRVPAGTSKPSGAVTTRFRSATGFARYAKPRSG